MAGLLNFERKPRIDPASVIALIQSQPRHYALDAPDKLKLKLDLPEPKARLAAARGLLTTLRG